MILSYENIEHIAAAVTRDFNCTVPVGGKKYEMNIDRFAKVYLGLEVSYRTLSDDGRVLGVTAYRDTAYSYEHNGEIMVLPLRRNQVLLDKSLAVFSDNVVGTRRRRFTLAHECAHQILFQLEVPEVQAACRSKYRAVAYSLRELKSHEDWNEWQANALGAALLMPADRLEQSIREIHGEIPLAFCNGYPTMRSRLLIENLCSRFSVSRTAMTIRLRQLGFITQNTLEVCA